MALKLLQPGLRPIGQFALDDDATAANVTGGEIGALQESAASDAAPADVKAHGPIANNNSRHVEVALVSSMNDHTAAADENDVPALAQAGIYMLDDGIKGYGTLFGESIGAMAGSGSTSQSGAVTIGPRTGLGSGKVTCWHQQGLYGITSPSDPTSCTGAAGDAFFTGEDITVGTSGQYKLNALLIAVVGKLKVAEDGTPTTLKQLGPHKFATNIQKYESPARIVGYFIGKMNDTSLVSTTSAAASGTASAECYAVHFLGANSSVYAAVQTDA